MAAIRSRNTKPEILLRRELFRRGFRYRLHGRNLPGRPDLVLAKYRAVVFVHGCFFHGHACPSFRWPASRPQFWRDKIEGNQRRDLATVERLRASSWRTLIVWECAITGRHRRNIAHLGDDVVTWLQSNQIAGSCAGHGC